MIDRMTNRMTIPEPFAKFPAPAAFSGRTQDLEMAMTATAQCIAVDWGTTSLRVMLLGDGGQVLDRVARPKGILAVPAGGFAAELEAACGEWRTDHPGLPVLMSGMIGSQQGWIEAPYLETPCGLSDLIAAMAEVPEVGGSVRIMPGVRGRTADGTPEIMRGEETQIGGVIAAHGVSDGLFCIPGTHSKWVQVSGGQIRSFATFMTGESFAILKAHSILGRLMAADDGHDPAVFRKGLARAQAPGGLLHQLFAARTLGILDEMPKSGLRSFLSGLLIGAEIDGARRLYDDLSPVHLVAGGAAGEPYTAAFEASGIAFTLWDAEAAALAGLWTAAKTLAS